MSNLKMFEWSAYGSIIISLLSDLAPGPNMGGLILFIVGTAILGLLIWAAAQRGQRWAAWVYFAFVALGLLGNIGEFWAGAPSWLGELVIPDTTPTALEKTLDVVWTLLAIVAFYFYLAALKPAASPARYNRAEEGD
jgi:hypothetical protein